MVEDTRFASLGRNSLIMAAVLSFLLIPGAQAGMRTIFYLPYASYRVHDGNVYQSRRVIFLGTVRSTTCDERNSASFQNEIGNQFREYIERNYTSYLGVTARQRDGWGHIPFQEIIGYWKWDRGDELVGQRDRMAKKYRTSDKPRAPDQAFPRRVLVNVSRFFFDCGRLSLGLSDGGCKQKLADVKREMNSSLKEAYKLLDQLRGASGSAANSIGKRIFSHMKRWENLSKQHERACPDVKGYIQKKKSEFAARFQAVFRSQFGK